MVSLLLLSLFSASPEAAPLRVAILSSVVYPPRAASEPINLRGPAHRVGPYLLRDVGFLAAPDVGKIEDRVRNCAADQPCICSVLKKARVDLAALLVLNAALKPAVFTAQLLEIRPCKSVASVLESIESEVESAIQKWVGTLFERAGYPSGGRLSVRVTPKDAILSLSEKRLASPQRLPPGAHEIVASKPGYVQARRTIDIVPGQDHEITLTLEKKGLLGSPWLWVGVGAGVIAGGAALGAYFALRPRDVVLHYGESPSR